MVLTVNVYPANTCPAFSQKTGYIAIAEQMTVCYAHGETIDSTIENFKQQYGGLLAMQFQSGNGFSFDFHVKLS